MKGLGWVIVAGLAGTACGNKGGDNPGSGLGSEEVFAFEDGVERKLEDMLKDPDCVALMPKIRAAGQVGASRGIKISVQEPDGGEVRNIYCWNAG